MAGHNSNVFHPGYLNGDANAWIEKSIIYRIPKTGVEYKQNMNWGLRLVALKKPGNGSVDSKQVMGLNLQEAGCGAGEACCYGE